jgi:hypothetical protein
MAAGDRSNARKSVIGDVICALTTPHRTHGSAAKSFETPYQMESSAIHTFRTYAISTMPATRQKLLPQYS